MTETTVQTTDNEEFMFEVEDTKCGNISDSLKYLSWHLRTECKADISNQEKLCPSLLLN